MRRQRVLRASSAQSLCIFCACRLGAIDLATTATSSTTISSTSHHVTSSSRRRPFSTTRASPQSVAAAAASSDSNAAPPTASSQEAPSSLPPWYDPQSSLSLTEQREKHNRLLSRQQHEQKEKQALEKAEEAAQRKRTNHGAPQSGASLFRRLPFDSSKAPQGQSLSQAMSSRPEERKAELRRNARQVVEGRQPFKIRRHEAVDKWRPRTKVAERKTTSNERGTQANRNTAYTGAQDSEGKLDPNLNRVSRKGPAKIAAPVFMQSNAANSAPAAASVVGWGLKSTGRQPLRYSDGTLEPDTKPVQQAHDENVTRLEPESLFDEAESKVTVESGRDDDTQQQTTQEHDVGASTLGTPETPTLDTHASATHSKLPPVASAETGAPDSFHHGSLEPQADNTKDVASQSRLVTQPDPASEPATEPQAGTATHESQIPEIADDANSATQPDFLASAISYSNEAPAVNTGSFGHFEETESAPAAAREGPSDRIEGSHSTLTASSGVRESNAPAVSKLSNASAEQNAMDDAKGPLPVLETSGSYENDTQFTPQHDQDKPKQQPSTPPGSIIGSQPAPAYETRTESPPRQPTVAPPSIPPPSVPPPAAPPQAAAAGQIVWQPVEGHPQGGRWIWEANPVPPSQPQAQTPPTSGTVQENFASQPRAAYEQTLPSRDQGQFGAQQQAREQQISPSKQQGYFGSQQQLRDQQVSPPNHQGHFASQQQPTRPPSGKQGFFASGRDIEKREPEEASRTAGTQGSPGHEHQRWQAFQQPSSAGSTTQGPKSDPFGFAQDYNPAPARNHLTGGGYRATPVSPEDFRFSESEIPQDVSKGWEHLRRKGDEVEKAQSAENEARISSASAQSPQAPQPARKPFVDEAEWVDRAFETYKRERDQRQAQQQQKRQQQQQREQSAHTQPDQNRSSRGLYDDQDTRNKKCARCGEIGHVARQCNKPDARLATSDTSMSNGASFQGSQMQDRGADSGRVGNPFAVRDPAQSSPEKSALGEPAQASFHFEPYAPSAPVDPFADEHGDDSKLSVKERARGKRAARFAQAEPEVDADGNGRDVRSGRLAQWAEDEDGVDDFRNIREGKGKEARRSQRSNDAEEAGRAGGRKGARSSRREFDEEDDDEEDAREKFRARKAARQREKERADEQRRKAARQEREARKAEASTPITLPEFISVQQLSQMLGVRYESFIDRLEELGYDDIVPGMTLNSETSGMIAMEYNFEPTFDTATEEEQRDLKARPEVEDQEFLPTRPPVVTIMGHVDHGKTTILDYLRKSSVAAGEAGGITQHIGAFSVPLAASGKTITFLDTPGHAAFLAMRQRGANVTDIVILVVAGDDSVKPQTLEAIKHAKAAGVPMIVAVNKIDKPETDIQRVKQDLARHGVEIEDFGGETQVVGVSGKTGEGMDELEENVVALSEQLDRRAETDGSVEGWILEATTKKSGRVATVLVRRGTLKTGTILVAGKTWARVKTLHNEAGTAIREVGPGMPVEVDGWRDQPMAGDEVLQAPSEQKASSVVEYRLEREERQRAAQDIEAINESRRLAAERQLQEKSAEQAMKQAQWTARQEGGTADVERADSQEQQSGQMVVPFIIKADVSGSAEAVTAYIMSVANPLITPSILNSGVGAVHESDIELAAAVEGHIIVFNVATNPELKGMAESRGVKLLENNIIYRVLDDVKNLLEDKLPPLVTQRVLGEAEIGQSFEIGIGGRKKMKIAGCKVRNGVVGKGSRVRVMRGSEKIYDGKIDSLKNVKKDVTEMRKGTECGMGFENWEAFEVGDQIQTYEEISEKRKL